MKEAIYTRDLENAWNAQGNLRVPRRMPELRAAMPEIIVSGPVACGKSYVMELIYKALRDAGLHPYSDELAHERRMVDEQPLPPAKVWKLRESIAAPQPAQADEAREE